MKVQGQVSYSQTQGLWLLEIWPYRKPTLLIVKADDVVN